VQVLGNENITFLENSAAFSFITGKVKENPKWMQRIKEAINSPMQIVEGYGGRKVAHRRYIIEDKEYLLRVIYEEKEDMHVVVTAYLTSQVERYWKEEK